MIALFGAVILALFISPLVHALRAIGEPAQVLVLGEGPEKNSKYLLSVLTDLGYVVSFSNTASRMYQFPDLMRRGEPVYDLIVIAISDNNGLTSKNMERIVEVVDFTPWQAHQDKSSRVGVANDGTNLLYFSPPSESRSSRILFERFGVIARHTAQEEPVWTRKSVSPSLPSVILDADTVFAQDGEILVGEMMTFKARTPRVSAKGPFPVIVGSSGAPPVLSFQGRSNRARVTMIGSLALAQQPVDGTPKNDVDAQRLFLAQIAGWTGGARGAIVVDSFEDTQVSGWPRDITERGDPMYTMGDVIQVTVQVGERNAAGEWTPYSAPDSEQDDIKDIHTPEGRPTTMQVEWVLQDTLARLALREDPTSPGIYRAAFRAPDKFGVFRFRITHAPEGYTHIAFEKDVPVRPPTKYQHERFVPKDWPYYISAVIAAVVACLVPAIIICSHSA